MASNPSTTVDFDAGAPEVGERRIILPQLPPDIADDFDWLVRDYDSFRLTMMEELAHRHPDRRRWTPADMEVVIVELVAAVLDRLSHAADTIHAERYLETARRPQSVRRLLLMIGYDAVAESGLSDVEALEQVWRERPSEMERHRANGPARIREQRRMVTLADHVRLFELHPLVERARARVVSRGAWTTVLVAVQLVDDLDLDQAWGRGAEADAGLQRRLNAFTIGHGLPDIDGNTVPRDALMALVAQYRMTGTELLLTGARTVPVHFVVTVQAAPQYYRSEILSAVTAVLAASADGLFRPGRLGFGDPVFASDIIETVVAVEGVQIAHVSGLRRLDRPAEDRSAAGFVTIAPDEIAVCLGQRGKGGFRVVVAGGLLG